VKTIQITKLLEIIKRLETAYGNKQWKRWRKPVDELIRTILSQNTNDKNSLQAFAQLKAKYGSWEQLLDAELDEIAETIRVGGLANSKAQRIKQALTKIKDERGKLSLEFLGDYSVEKAANYLESLDGVGPKTAACVLIFSFNFPIIPVDTHVHRLSNRLGLVTTTSREKTHDELNQIVPQEKMYSFHLNLIEHGRKICKASTPLCSECFLTELCDYYQTEKE
jgi:endonuclease-3